MPNRSTTTSDLTRGELAVIRERYRADLVLYLDVAGVGLVLQSNDSDVLARLAHYFRAYVVDRPRADSLPIYLFQGLPTYDPSKLRDLPRETADRPVKEAIYDATEARIVLKRRTGVTIYVAESELVVVGDLQTNLNQAVNVVTMAFARAKLKEGFVMVHASAVDGPSGGIAFASVSGSGKSTVALNLVDRGYRFVTNDRLLVRASGGTVEMLGVPKFSRVNPGTLLSIPRLTQILGDDERREYAELGRDDLWVLERKHDVDVDDVYGPGTFQLGGDLRHVYLLRWGLRGEGLSMRPLDTAERGASLNAIVKRVGTYERSPRDPAIDESLLAAVTEYIAIYDVTGRADPARLAAEIAGNAT